MRGFVRFRHANPEEDSRVIDGARENSVDAVLWDIGVVLAVFLGLALAAGATLTAFGAN